MKFAIGSFFLLLVAWFVIWLIETVLFGLSVPRTGVTRTLASDCHMPANAEKDGGVIVADTRDGSRGNAFVMGNDPDAWLASMARSLGPIETGPGLVVVYVHGFWPSEFGALGFSDAQKAAKEAAPYLAALTERLSDRRIVIVAHSLGSAVAMEALGLLRLSRGEPPLEALVLIQGAIPSTSIRNWKFRSVRTEPGPDLDRRMAGLETHDRVVTTLKGKGCFVDAAMRAKRLIVTLARRDVTLKGWYDTHSLYFGNDCVGPEIPGRPGTLPQRLPQYQAVGVPIRKRFFTSDFDKRDQKYTGEVSSPTAIADSFEEVYVEWQVDVTVDFCAPHPHYREVHLLGLNGFWFLVFNLRYFFFDWHSPLIDETVRGALLAQLWFLIGEETGDATLGECA